MTRAYAYARFSTDRQSESSLEDQFRACREYAARAGLELAGEHADSGISGAALGNRPGALAVLAQLAAGDVLVIADLSRLSRSQDLAPMLERLRFRGVRVIGVLDGFDSESATARMQAGLSGIMSDELRASIRSRTHLALESRAKSGSPTGGRAYGYGSDGKPREPEAAIAREIFRRFAAGESSRDIANDLNARGIPSPGSTWNRASRARHGRWLVSALHEILSNERYTGRVIWNRSRWVKDPDTGKRMRRERPRSEWIETEGAPLIDGATWEAVRARLTERERFGGGRGGAPRYLLSGILTCAECGSRMIVTGGSSRRYRCSTHHHGGPAACSLGLSVRREVAEEVILEPIRRDLLSPEAVEVAVAAMQAWAREDRVRVSPASPEVLDAERELEEVRALAVARPELAALAAAVAGAEDRLTRARRAAWRAAQARRPDAPAAFAEAYRAAAARLRETLEARSGPGRALLRDLLGDVRVRAAAGGGHLEALVGISPVPLLRAAGAGEWLASGPPLPSRSLLVIALRAAA